MVRARRLRKQFGDFVAVGGIDLELRRGEVFGFLGPALVTGSGEPDASVFTIVSAGAWVAITGDADAWLEADDGPTALSAFTEKQKVVPLVRPVTLQEVAVGASGDEVTGVEDSPPEVVTGYTS